MRTPTKHRASVPSRHTAFRSIALNELAIPDAAGAKYRRSRRKFPGVGPASAQHLSSFTSPFAAAQALPFAPAWGTPSLIGIRASRIVRWLLILATVALCAGYILPAASILAPGGLFSGSAT